MTFGGLPAAGNALLFEDKAEVVFSGTEADYGLLLHVKAHNRLRSVDPVLVHTPHHVVQNNFCGSKSHTITSLSRMNFRRLTPIHFPYRCHGLIAPSSPPISSQIFEDGFFPDKDLAAAGSFKLEVINEQPAAAAAAADYESVVCNLDYRGRVEVRDSEYGVLRS